MEIGYGPSIVYYHAMKKVQSLRFGGGWAFLIPNSSFLIRPSHRLALFLTVTVICCLPARTALADAIVVTKAMTASTVVEVFIEESEIRVEMEIGVADLLAFHNLLPDEIGRASCRERV